MTRNIRIQPVELFEAPIKVVWSEFHQKLLVLGRRILYTFDSDLFVSKPFLSTEDYTFQDIDVHKNGRVVVLLQSTQSLKGEIKILSPNLFTLLKKIKIAGSLFKFAKFTSDGNVVAISELSSTSTTGGVSSRVFVIEPDSNDFPSEGTISSVGSIVGITVNEESNLVLAASSGGDVFKIPTKSQFVKVDLSTESESISTEMDDLSSESSLEIIRFEPIKIGNIGPGVTSVFVGLKSTTPGNALQTKVRVFVGSKPWLNDRWDSKELETSKTGVLYGGGDNLVPGQSYWVHVSIFDNESGWSRPQIQKFTVPNAQTTFIEDLSSSSQSSSSHSSSSKSSKSSLSSSMSSISSTSSSSVSSTSSSSISSTSSSSVSSTSSSSISSTSSSSVSSTSSSSVSSTSSSSVSSTSSSSVSSPSSLSTPTSLSSMSSVSSPSSLSTPTSLSSMSSVSSTSSSSVSSTSISSPQSVIAEEGQTILISGGKLVYYPIYDGHNESGDYIYEDTWIKVSNDSGVTWSDPIGLPLSGGFYSNMLISSNGQFITVVFSENWWKSDNSPVWSHSQNAKVYRSNDSGAHFYQINVSSGNLDIGVDSERYYGSGACSPDGQFQTIVFSNGKYISSNNYGQDWYVSYRYVDIEKFKSIYMSKDGTTQIIAGSEGIYQRGLPGADVKLRASLPGSLATEPEAIANFNGTQGVLALSTNSLDNYNKVWLSKDGANGSYYEVFNFPLGNSPYYTDMNRYLPCVASSIDGKYMIVAKTKVFISYNYGVDWVEKTELLYTTSLSMSGSGKYIVATGFDGPFEETRVNKVRYSSDYGRTWTDSHAPDLLQNLGEINRCLISSGIPY